MSFAAQQRILGLTFIEQEAMNALQDLSEHAAQQRKQLHSRLLAEKERVKDEVRREVENEAKVQLDAVIRETVKACKQRAAKDTADACQRLRQEFEVQISTLRGEQTHTGTPGSGARA